MMVTPARPPFALLQEDARWWSLNDYGAVLGVMRTVQPARVLEFGPGSSTKALIEGGAQHIDACEDLPEWRDVWQERLAEAFPTAEWPTTIALHEFTNQKFLRIPAIDKASYDFALIDGPRGTETRGGAIAYAVARTPVVMVADAKPLRPVIEAIAAKRKRAVTWIDTGPLSEQFAIIHAPAPMSTPTPFGESA